MEEPKEEKTASIIFRKPNTEEFRIKVSTEEYYPFYNVKDLAEHLARIKLLEDIEVSIIVEQKYLVSATKEKEE